MDHIEAHEASIRAREHISSICDEYGLYGNIVYHNPCPSAGADGNRVYIVAGCDPAIQGNAVVQGMTPDEIIRRSEQNNKLFYPNAWAFDLSANSSQMKAQEELVEYLKKAEFVKMLYAQYGLEPPEKLRVSEVYQLIDFHDLSLNPKVNQETRDKAKKDLAWFFEREKSKGFRRQWLDYFRSDHFPDDKGPIAKVSGFFTRDKQRTSLENLMEVSEDIHKIQMQEHEYSLFVRYLEKLYPDITFAASEKEIVNHGGVNNPQETEAAIGRRITGEEFAVIRKDRFAEEGWEALENLKPAYWEFRDVYYKACDEPRIATAYNSITLQYAKCDALADLHGPVHMIDVPVTDFMNFVSLAKANNLRFYIDNVGDFATPSLETVHVIYSEFQQEKLQGIVERMMDDKIEFSHITEGGDNRAPLSEVIEAMENLRIQQKPEHIIKHDRSRN